MLAIGSHAATGAMLLWVICNANYGHSDIQAQAVATKGHADAQDLGLHSCGLLGAQGLCCCHLGPENYTGLSCGPATARVCADVQVSCCH